MDRSHTRMKSDHLNRHRATTRFGATVAATVALNTGDWS
jgi:hypothetical protein